jgi:hypothetical protein
LPPRKWQDRELKTGRFFPGRLRSRLGRAAATVTIISDSARVPAPSSQLGDWHDVTGHHRYCGSSACNGGGRIVETRRGSRPQSNLCGF